MFNGCDLFLPEGICICSSWEIIVGGPVRSLWFSTFHTFFLFKVCLLKNDSKGMLHQLVDRATVFSCHGAFWINSFMWSQTILKEMSSSINEQTFKLFIVFRQKQLSDLLPHLASHFLMLLSNCVKSLYLQKNVHINQGEVSLSPRLQNFIMHCYQVHVVNSNLQVILSNL